MQSMKAIARKAARALHQQQSSQNSTSYFPSQGNSYFQTQQVSAKKPHRHQALIRSVTRFDEIGELLKRETNPIIPTQSAMKRLRGSSAVSRSAQRRKERLMRQQTQE